MAHGAGRYLLVGEHASLLADALKSVPDRHLARAEELGVDCGKILAALIDKLSTPEGCDADAECGLLDAAWHLCEREAPWEMASGLCQALIDRIYAGADGTGEPAQLERLSRGMLQAQARLFELYLEAREEKRKRLAAHLREVDRFPDSIAATLDPPTLIKVGLGRLKELLGMGGAAICELDEQRRLLPVAGDLPGERESLAPLQLHAGAACTLLACNDPYWEVPAEGSAGLGALVPSGGARAVLALPMTVRGRTTSVILLWDGPERKDFTADELELAARFANRLSVALENASLHQREQRKIKETVALLEITRAINSTLDLREILDKVARMTVDLSGVVMCSVYLKRQDGRFFPAASYGFIADGGRVEEGDEGFLLDRLQPETVRKLERGEALALAGAEAACLLPLETMYEHGVDLVFAVPLHAREGLAGLFALFYPFRRDKGLEREETEVVEAIAAHAAMAIENAALYEDIEKSYFSTVQALAKAIEVKDPYTHGHSERVMEYALLIADAMRLDERERQRLKYAATLHDIGKIGIAGRVLNKPGELTAEEYRHVKTHPLLGDSIIEPVEFLQGPRPIILHHHERFDGTGYPAGLKGTDIPLCARILSVADAFEAMRSDRPYRRALPFSQAVEELIRNAGSQFDPEVVEVFLGILERHGGDPIRR